MDKIGDLIKQYLKETIYTKKNMRKRIYQLEDELKSIKENEKYIIEQRNKYKEVNRKLRRKLKERK